MVAQSLNITLEIRKYPSSVEANLELSAEFYIPPEPRPLCLFFHGWHMSAAESKKSGVIYPLLSDFFVVNVDMRGRGGNPGKPDASGHELIDGLDALAYACKTWPEKIAKRKGPYIVGGSGGGGNTLALVGKAPDFFSAGVSWAGMSDYALWYQSDKRGAYRDEMENKGWIGGTPQTNPEGYHSRGGLHVIENVITKLLVIHGRRDGSVPPISADEYKLKANRLGKKNIRVYLNNKEHSSIEWPMALRHLKKHTTLPVLKPKGTLLVHSFLACRSFWLVLDHPSKMGKVNYELDIKGKLISLSFYQNPRQSPVEEVRLRVFEPILKLQINMGGQEKILKTRLMNEEYSEFRWSSRAPWTAMVLRSEHIRFAQRKLRG